MAERIPRLITGVTAKFPSSLRTKPTVQEAPKPTGISLVLPWPPSMNSYWRRHGHIIHISQAGRKYREAVVQLVGWKFEHDSIDYPVSVLIEAKAPNKRSWDVDNRPKALLDALTHAGVWTDDSLVRDMRIVDRGIESPGSVLVTISRFMGNQ